MLEKKLGLLGYECRVILNDVAGIPIAFLHGYAFTSDVWQEIGVLQRLEEEKIPFLALDMPYGLKSKCTPKTRKPETNVRILEEALQRVFGSKKSFLVGASLGGYIALRYSLKHPVRGMLLVAPAMSLEEELVHNYPKLTNPVYVIYGTRDEIVSLEEMKKLVNALPKAKLFLYDGARHPAYLDNPNDFRKHLLEAYRISQREKDI